MTETTIPHLPELIHGRVWLWQARPPQDARSWAESALTEYGCLPHRINDPADIQPSMINRRSGNVLLIDPGVDASAAEELACLAQAKTRLIQPMPILLLGQQTALEARIAAIAAGASRYLPGAMTTMHLLDAVAAAIRRSVSDEARVLIVAPEDDAKVCIDALSKAGLITQHLPSTAHEQLLTTLETFPANVLVLDLHLPDYRATDLAQALRSDERYAHLCYVFLGDDDQAARSSAPVCEWSGVHFVSKPIRPQRLVALVKARLRAAKRAHDARFALSIALHESRQQARAINAHAIVSVTDTKGAILSVNDRFCEITGYDRAEVLGRTHRMIHSGHHDETFYQALWNTISSGEIWRGELCNRSKDGELFWVLTTIVPFLDLQNQPYAYLAIRTDVTPLKRHSEQLRWQARALDAIANGVGITDARHDTNQLVYINHAFTHITGYAANEVLGRSCQFLHGPETDRAIIKAMVAAMRQGQQTQSTLRTYRKDGTPFWNRMRITPIRDEQGELTHHVAILEDVTETLNAQEALRAERDFIHTTINAIPSMFFLIDAELRLIKINTKFVELTGYDEEALKTISALDLFAESARPRAQQAFATAFAEHDSVAMELNLQTRAGDQIPLYLRAERHCLQGIEVLVGTGQDMREYRQILDSLHLTEDRLNRSQAFANIGLIDWNITTDTVYWSDRVPILLGVTETRLGFGLHAFFDAIDPRDRQRVREAMDRCRGAYDICDEDFRVPLPSGQDRWMLLRGNVAYNEAGEVNRMLMVVQDITGLKQAEIIEKQARRDVQAIIDSLCALICVVDAKGTIQSVNRSWARADWHLLGNHDTQQPGTNYLERCRQLAATGHRDLGVLADGIQALLTGTKRGFETEIHIAGDVDDDEANEDTVHLVRVTPLQGAERTHPRVVISHQDITEQRQTENELRDAKETAERASQAKSEFLSSMSHELRTPMNAVLGFAQLLEYDDQLEDDQRESVNEILRAGQHLLELINSVLDLAQVEAGHMDMSIEPLEIDAVAGECLALIEPLARPRAIRLNIDDLGGLRVLADRVRLKQVLINLLSNAVKYNREGGKVWLAATAQPDASTVRLSINDNGLGIHPEQIQQLFQPFTRLVADGSVVEGTGIGLAVCRRLVEAMNGTIGVSSALGEGSQFWFELPAALPHAQPAAPVENAEPQWELESKTRYLVLQIEDNPANLKLMERMLAKRATFDVLSATSAREGLALAHSHHPDVILMDINMPGMDGYSALAKLRADPSIANIPVIALTANATTEDIAQGEAAGFNAYLTKPLNISALLEIIDRLLQ